MFLRKNALLSLLAVTALSSCFFKPHPPKQGALLADAAAGGGLKAAESSNIDAWQLRCEKVKLDAPSSLLPSGSTFLMCRGVDGAGRMFSLADVPGARLKWQITVPDEVVINGLVENPASTPSRASATESIGRVNASTRPDGVWSIIELYTELTRPDGSQDTLAINERLSRVSVVAHVSVEDTRHPKKAREALLGGVLDQLIEPGGLTADTTIVKPFPGYFDAFGPSGYRGACDSESAIYRGQSASLSNAATSFCVYRPSRS